MGQRQCRPVVLGRTHPETHAIQNLVSQTFPRPEMKERALENSQWRNIHLAKKPFAHPCGKGFHDRIGPHPTQDFVGKRCSQEIVRQEEAEKEHSLTTQLLSLFHNPSPIQSFVSADQFGNAAD